MQQHLAAKPPSSSAIMSTALVSDRLGVENMDGQGILSGHAKCYARPWTGRIPFEELTKDNLPPFYVRLQDDQVGHLVFWVGTSRSSITRLKLGQVWPWDFDVHGKISSRRDSWGAEYNGCGTERGKGLGGGTKVPTWTDAGLPLTYTSSHKVMAEELDALQKGAAGKRKAEEEAGKNACMPVKKPRLSSVSAELKRMKETAEKKRQKDKGPDKETERYTGAKPELRDAMHIVDTLMRSATETENLNATLELMLVKKEELYIKDMDDIFDEWLAYNGVKRMEVDRILEDHAVEIKSHDAKIEASETKAKGFRARLDREKQRVRVRDERLARVKNRWVQEQDLMAGKFREIEEMAINLDELSELNDGTDESEYFEESGPEEAEEEAKEVKEPEPKGQVNISPDTPLPGPTMDTTDRLLPHHETPVRQRTRVPTVDRELRESIARQRIKKCDAKDLVNLDEDEEEDEGPISSRRMGQLRSSIRAKPA